ncbi:hypothetical protein QYF36_022570 [Acer negundo]|nr:hypothetical protein QYF36_022570 [Acer negundo]
MKVEGSTDSVRDLKEATKVSHINILSRLSGPGSSQVHGLRLEDPSEEALLIKKKAVVEGKEVNWQGLMDKKYSKGEFGLELKLEGPNLIRGPIKEMAMVCSSQSNLQIFSKQNSNRNWKRLERAKKTKIITHNQSNLFRNLQTVNTKGKKSLKGNVSTSTSKSKFNVAGKRSNLGKYHNSSQVSSKERGTLSSSLK